MKRLLFLSRNTADKSTCDRKKRIFYRNESKIVCLCRERSKNDFKIGNFKKKLMQYKKVVNEERGSVRI